MPLTFKNKSSGYISTATPHILFKMGNGPRKGQITWDYDKAPDPDTLPGKYVGNENFVGVQWGTGFAVITIEAFAKLTPKKLKLLQPERR